MKELIVKALSKALLMVERQVPQTKKQVESISIMDIKPIDIPLLMRNQNIPDNSYFSGKDNGCDAWNDILLCWEIDAPTTDEDKQKFKRNRFSAIAYKFVYDLLIENNYKRIPFDSRFVKQLNNISIYEMYADKNFDGLVSYYSLFFVAS